MKEPLYKVIFLGPRESGKSHLIAALTETFYSNKLSIGVDFHKLKVDNMHLQLWDVNSTNRMEMDRLYLRGAHLIVVMVNAKDDLSKIKNYVENEIKWVMKCVDNYDNTVLV